jgi:hypothetical protein
VAYRSHGGATVPTTNADVINADLLAFFKS